MAMDLRDPNVWISHLLENLPEEKLASALKDDNPNWEYIDGEIVKLGSLAHSQLDIPELQRRGLVILASESKDFRLLAHLLRTLQHAGDPHLALRLLALYVEHYWAVAAPQNMAHKKRFASQVIKRFETGIEVFSQNAATAQRDALSGELAKLAQCWQSHNAPELAQATDDLFALYQRAFNRAAPAPVPTPAASGSSPQTTATSESGVTQPSAPAPQIVIDSHDDKAWRDTLLKVAAILCERQPDSPQGYRLRRHALWQNITSTPGRKAMAVLHWLRSPPIWWQITMLSSVVPIWRCGSRWRKAYCWLLTGWMVTAFLHRRRCVWVTNRWQTPSAMRSSASLSVCPSLPGCCLMTTHRLSVSRRNNGWQLRPTPKLHRLRKSVRNRRQPEPVLLSRVWRRRCDIWTCYPKAIPAISFTASTLPHS